VGDSGPVVEEVAGAVVEEDVPGVVRWVASAVEEVCVDRTPEPVGGAQAGCSNRRSRRQGPRPPRDAVRRPVERRPRARVARPTPESTTFGELSIDDYDEARAEMNAFWASMNGTQAGDPAKLARALVQLADSPEPPLRWVAGEDVVKGVEDKARLLLAQVDAHRDLSTSLAHEDAKAAA
jgi:hypothetical protein